MDEFELRARGATYEQIAAGGGGIRSTVRWTRATNEEELLQEAGSRIRWALRCGTTTMEAKSGYGLSLDEELKMLRVIGRLDENSPMEFVPTFLGAHAVPEEFEGRPDDYVSLVVEEMIPEVVRQGLAEYCDIFYERRLFRRARRLGEFSQQRRQPGLGLRMHADQLTNSGGAALAAELGAVTADHLEQTEEEGIAAMQAAGVQPVLLPASVYALGKTRYPKARAMIDAGLAVVLATDFNPGLVAHAFDPDGAFARGDANEDDAGGRYHRRHDQCRLQPAGAANKSVHSKKEKSRTSLSSSCADYREIAYWFGSAQSEQVYVRGRRVV